MRRVATIHLETAALSPSFPTIPYLFEAVHDSLPTLAAAQIAVTGTSLVVATECTQLAQSLVYAVSGSEHWVHDVQHVWILKCRGETA